MGNLVNTKRMHLQNKCYHSQNNSWFQLMPTLRLVFICKLFQSSLQVAEFKTHGVSPVLFILRRLRYLLRMCIRLLGRNLAQQNTSLETPVIIASFTPKLWITLTALDPKNYHPKYNTGFIVTSNVNETFLDGGIHSLMLAN